MHTPNRSYCCCCIPFRFAVAILSLLTLALGGSALWAALNTGFTDSSYRIASFVVSGIYCLLGVSGLFAVIFKKYALAKNFSVLWWTVTIVTTILSIISVVLLATRGKEEILSKCEAKYAGGDYGPEYVDQCAKYWVIVTGVFVAIQFVVMSIGGWVASRYTSEVKHQNEGLAYTYGEGYGPVHPQPMPHHSAAHPYTNIGTKNQW